MNRIRDFLRHTFRSLGVRNYRLYFIGQAISLCGTWMQTVAQDWLVLKLTGSGTQLGLVLACQFLPMLILGPFGGVIADRFDKRKILFFTQTAAGILALGLGLLVATGLIQVWMVYLFALSLGLIIVFDNPARQTFAPQMVGKELLQNAVTLNSTEINLARAIGPAIGGTLIATIGLAPCFILNGISYIAVIIVLSMMRPDELHHTPLARRAKGQLREGLRYVKSTPLLFNTLLMMSIIGTFSFEFSVSLPLLARFGFHGDAQAYTALVTALGIGAAAGGLFAASRKKVTPRMLVYSALFFGVTLVAASMMPTLALAVVFMTLAGVGLINVISLGNTTLQLESVPEMRGRVMSLWAMAFLGSTPIGGPIIGIIGEYIGARWGLAAGGIAAILAAGFGTVTMLKKRAPGEEIPESVKIADEEALAEEDIRMR